MAVGNVSRNIRNRLVYVLKGAADVAGSTVVLTRSATARYLRASTSRKARASRWIEDVVEETVVGAMKGGSDAGKDLPSVAKAAVIGAIEGVSKVTNVTDSVLSNATRAAVKGAEQLNGDVVEVARRAVEGAVEAGQEAGLDTKDAARAAAIGAAEGAEDLSETLADAVARAIAGTISGMRGILETAFKRPPVLIVSSSRSDAEDLGKSLGREGYETSTAGSLAELDEIIRSRERIRLVLVDIAGLEKAVWELCAELQKARIPLVVIAPQRSPVVQQESLRCGARGVLVKPISARELTEHIRALIGG
jgi:CheY-like chemotaxis protein